MINPPEESKSQSESEEETDCPVTIAKKSNFAYPFASNITSTGEPSLTQRLVDEYKTLCSKARMSVATT